MKQCQRDKSYEMRTTDKRIIWKEMPKCRSVSLSVVRQPQSISQPDRLPMFPLMSEHKRYQEYWRIAVSHSEGLKKEKCCLGEEKDKFKAKSQVNRRMAAVSSENRKLPSRQAV